MSIREEELVQFGFEVIVKAFEKQKKRLKIQISKLQKIIAGLLEENTHLKREKEKYYNAHMLLKTNYQQIYSTFEKNQSKLYTIQRSILEDNRPKKCNIIENEINFNQNNNNQEPTEADVIGKKITRSFSYNSIQRKGNCLHSEQQLTTYQHNYNFTKEFLNQCKNELDFEVYNQILLLFQEYQEGKLKDNYVIKQIHIILSGNTKLLKLFENLLK